MNRNLIMDIVPPSPRPEARHRIPADYFQPRPAPRPQPVVQSAQALPELQPYVPTQPVTKPQIHRPEPRPQPATISRSQPVHYSRPVPAPPRRPVPQQPAETPSMLPPLEPKKGFSLRGLLTLFLLLVVGLALGLASHNQKLGQLAIAGYAVVALIFRIKSQYTFGAALFTLAMVPFLIVINKEGLADNYAIYSYLLLVVGVVSAVLELLLDKRRGLASEQ